MVEPLDGTLVGEHMVERDEREVPLGGGVRRQETLDKRGHRFYFSRRGQAGQQAFDFVEKPEKNRVLRCERIRDLHAAGIMEKQDTGGNLITRSARSVMRRRLQRRAAGNQRSKSRWRDRRPTP